MSSLPAAVLWDLDGTLIDTEPYWIACEHELVARYGGQWTDADAHSIVGFDLLDGAKVIRDRGGVNLQPQAIVDQLVAGVVARIRQHMPWRPGARELLGALNRAGVPCGLVTMSWRNITDEVMRALPPGSFQTVISGDMVLNGKPHPEPYRRAAEELGVDPLSCVAIEDSPTGVASAEAAGCVVVAVPNVVPVLPVEHRVTLRSLAGVTPEQLGEWVETTPPPPGVATMPAVERTARPYDAAADGSFPITRSARGGVDQRAWARGRSRAMGRRRLFGILAVLALLLGGLAIWWFAIRSEREAYAPGAFNVHTWAVAGAVDSATDDLADQYNLFHQVSPFWYAATGAESIVTNTNVDQADLDAFTDMARSRGVPIVASIFDETQPGVMAAILGDPTSRARHIEAIAEFAADNQFAGIDLDYEVFAFGAGEKAAWETTRDSFSTFVAELSARLAADGRILVVTVPPIYDTGQTDDSGYWVYDYGAIAPHVDAIRIMTYDYTNLSSDVPGPIAPLEWVDTAIDAGTDAAGGPEKLVLGIPLFGYNWVIATTGECPDSAEGDISQTLSRIDEVIAREGITPSFDATTGESSFTYQLTVEEGDQSCIQTREVRYVDEEGIRERMELSINKGMKGVALFSFGYESPGVFTDIADINATLATTIPAGSVSATTAPPTTVTPPTTVPAATTAAAPVATATTVAPTAGPSTTRPSTTTA